MFDEENYYQEPEVSDSGSWQQYQESEPQNTSGEWNDSYQDNSYTQNTTYQQPVSGIQNAGQGFGIASMVCGIISLVLFCSCLNIPLAVIALVFGIIQLTKAGTSKGMAITGIITACLSILLLVGFMAMFVLSANVQSELGNTLDLYEQYEDFEDFDFNFDDTF